MEKTKKPLFSNSTELMSWVGRNCDQCWKQSNYKEKTDTYSPFYCSIDRDIQMQGAGLDNPVNLKSHEVCQGPDCPYKELTRKNIHAKRQVRDQPEISFG